VLHKPGFRETFAMAFILLFIAFTVD